MWGGASVGFLHFRGLRACRCSEKQVLRKQNPHKEREERLPSVGTDNQHSGEQKRRPHLRHPPNYCHREQYPERLPRCIREGTAPRRTRTREPQESPALVAKAPPSAAFLDTGHRNTDGKLARHGGYTIRMHSQPLGRPHMLKLNRTSSTEEGVYTLVIRSAIYSFPGNWTLKRPIKTPTS